MANGFVVEETFWTNIYSKKTSRGKNAVAMQIYHRSSVPKGTINNMKKAKRAFGIMEILFIFGFSFCAPKKE